MSTTQRDPASTLRPSAPRDAAGLSPLPRVAVALGMSALLWLYVLSVTDPARTTTIRYPAIPVQLRNADPNLVLEETPKTVAVEVRSALLSRNGQTQDPLAAYVDLSGMTAGTRLVEVRIEGIDEEQLISVQPSQVRIQAEAAESVTLPIAIGPSLAEVPPEHRERVRIEPSQVRITGSSADLKRIREVWVDIDPEALTPGTTQNAQVLAVDRMNRPVQPQRISPDQVRVILPPLPTATP
ncbi:MAG: CdaR family protein [Chloroflexota bacterium]|nr:CdaR family protein [Chloroflexota bacterium]